jgi:hypothetical protein
MHSFNTMLYRFFLMGGSAMLSPSRVTDGIFALQLLVFPVGQPTGMSNPSNVPASKVWHRCTKLHQPVLSVFSVLESAIWSLKGKTNATQANQSMERIK